MSFFEMQPMGGSRFMPRGGYSVGGYSVGGAKEQPKALALNQEVMQLAREKYNDMGDISAYDAIMEAKRELNATDKSGLYKKPTAAQLKQVASTPKERKPRKKVVKPRYDTSLPQLRREVRYAVRPKGRTGLTSKGVERHSLKRADLNKVLTLIDEIGGEVDLQGGGWGDIFGTILKVVPHLLGL